MSRINRNHSGSLSGFQRYWQVRFDNIGNETEFERGYKLAINEILGDLESTITYLKGNNRLL